MWFNSLSPDIEYTGAKPLPGSKPHPTGYASGGAGYYLSRRAATVVTEKLGIWKKGYEDAIVGTLMRDARIQFRQDPRFVPFGNDIRRPLPGNDFITSHKIPDDLWLDSWKKIHEER